MLALGLVLRLTAWYEFPNTNWPDEIYQSLEQAHRVVFRYGVVPWEFREGTRSWLVPGLLAALMQLTSWVTSSPTAYLAACATALTTVSLAPVWVTFRSALTLFNLRAAVVAALIVVSWFELVYFAPKALNEVIAAHCLAAGVMFADAAARDRSESPRAAVGATVMLALASMLRIQLSIAGFGCFVYLFARMPKTVRIRAVAAGGAVVVALGLLDWVTWTYPFQSYVENVRINVVVGRSANWGTAPWYAYFEVFARAWGWWGLVIIVTACIGARLRPLFAFAVLAVLLAHMPIAHKEYRFAYPAALLVIMLAALGTAQLLNSIGKRVPRRTHLLAAAALATAWITASLQRATVFEEKNTRLGIALGASQPHWELRRGGLVLMADVGRDPDTCGIELVGLTIFDTGGYAYFHRDLPIYETRRREDIEGLTPYVNVYLIARALNPEEEFRGYVRQRCVAELCVYKRPGSCEKMLGYSINNVLTASGR